MQVYCFKVSLFALLFLSNQQFLREDAFLDKNQILRQY